MFANEGTQGLKKIKEKADENEDREESKEPHAEVIDEETMGGFEQSKERIFEENNEDIMVADDQSDISYDEETVGPVSLQEEYS